MDNLYWLDQIQTKHHQQVGDQALHLSYLRQRGYAVVPSFVVSSRLFREFLESIPWADPLFFDLARSSLHLNVEDALQLQAIARQIQHTIVSAPLPSAWVAELEAAVSKLQAGFDETTPVQAVILHPSLVLEAAKASGFTPTITPESANLLEAQVCWTDAAWLEAGLKRLWAQVFRARNLLFWQRSHIQLHQIQLAILVQPVFNATASGYLQRNDTGWEVLAAWGLGQAIAQGEVLPDSYRIDAESGSVLSQKLGSKTIAYQILKASDAFVEKTPLQLTLLNEAQDKQFVLDAAYLQQFGQLAQRLAADFSSLLVLEWTLAPNQPVLFMQVSTQMSASQASVAQNDPVPQEQPREVIVAGLAAASGRTIAQATVITSSRPVAVAPGTILVASTIMPDWLPLLKQAAGIVAEQGGMTSHGAIVAREFGIPAVVGAVRATQRIQTGDWLLIDGDRGEVYAADPTLQNPKPVNMQPMSSSDDAAPFAIHKAPIATQLMVNLSQIDRLEQVAALPSDGVGLLRSELMIQTILEFQHPDLWLQQGREAELSDRLTEQICQFAAAFAPRPVFYRSLDLRSHEFRSLAGGAAIPTETNPVLGMRGTFSYLLNPTLFEIELKALNQAYQAGHSNLKLILPFVRTVEEFVFCRQRVEQIGLAHHPQFQLWIMAEVPSVIFLLPDYVQAGVQGITIGTNDLTQLLLGVDRDQSLMASAFDENHPAVFRAIAHLIKTARQLNIPCSICGSVPVQHPGLIDQLVQWGITSISVNPASVEAAYQAIARAEQRFLIEGMRDERGI